MQQIRGGKAKVEGAYFARDRTPNAAADEEVAHFTKEIAAQGDTSPSKK